MAAFRPTALLYLSIGILTLTTGAPPPVAAAADDGEKTEARSTRPPPAAGSPATPTATTRPTKTGPAAGKPSTRPVATPPPTEAEIRAAFEGGDYKATVELINRALGHRGSGAPAYDRYELTLLRADCHLRLKQVLSAADAFKVAARLTKDESKAAAARATTRLVLETKGGTVTQRHPPAGAAPATADLVDPAQRPLALRIYRDDLRAEANPKVTAALKATTIPPIPPALDALWLKLDFERATEDGTYDRDVQVRRDLAERVRWLITDELDVMEGAVDRIWASASTVVSERPPRNIGIGSRSSITYRGLSKADLAELDLVVATCDRIRPTLVRLGRATGSEPARDRAMIRRAADIRSVTLGVVNNKYYDPGMEGAGRDRQGAPPARRLGSGGGIRPAH